MKSRLKERTLNSGVAGSIGRSSIDVGAGDLSFEAGSVTFGGGSAPPDDAVRRWSCSRFPPFVLRPCDIRRETENRCGLVPHHLVSYRRGRLSTPMPLITRWVPAWCDRFSPWPRW